MATDKTHRHPIDALTAGSEWVDRLLELFWTVDKVLAGQGESVPEAIIAAHARAEEARKAL